MADPFDQFQTVKDTDTPITTDPFEQFATVKGENNAFDTAAGFGGGVNVGLTNIVGAPVDITNAVLSLVGLDAKEPVGGSAWLRRQFGKVEAIPGIGDPFFKGPNTTLGRLAHRTGEEIGASAIPAAGLLRASRGVVPALQTGRGILREVVLDPISRAPGVATVGEAAAATGAGVGAGIAQENFPDSQGAETTGQIVGGITPAILAQTPTAMVTRMVRSVVSRFSPSGQVKAATKTVRNLLGNTLTDEARKGIVEAEALTQKIPGLKLSVAESTKNKALRLQQEHLENEATGEFLDQVVRRREQNEQSLETFRKGKFPESDVDAEYVINTANKRIETVGDSIERLTGRVVQKQEDLANKLPTIDKLQNGTALRNGVNEARKLRSTEMSLKAQDLNIADVDFTPEFKAWQTEIEAAYKPKSRFVGGDDQTPDILKQIINDKAETTNFQDIKAIRERITDDLINETASATPSRQRVRALTLLKKDVDEFMEEVGGTLGESWQKFRQVYFEEYVKPFESGAMFKSKNKDGTGFFRTRDEAVADLFTANQSAAKQYNDVFQNDPAMMQNMENALLDDMRRSVAPNGFVDEKKLATWTRKKDGALKEFPNIKAKVAGVKGAQEQLINRQAQLAKRRVEIEDKTLVKQMGKFAKGDVTPDRILNDALQSPQKMQLLVNTIDKDPNASIALRRLIWNKATSGTSEEIVQFIADNGKSLQKVFTPKHLEDITNVSIVRGMLDSVKTPKGTAYFPEPLAKFERFAGMRLPQAGTRLYALRTGRLSKSFLVFDAAKSVLYSKAKLNIEKIIKEALYDPRVARELSESFEFGNFDVKKANQLGARVFALGVPFLETEEQAE